MKLGDREQMVDDFLDREIRNVKNRVTGLADPTKFYTLNAEPVSALFVNKAKVFVNDVANPSNPLDVEVLSEAEFEWNDWALDYIKELEGYGIDVTKFKRTGGVYQSTFSNKKIRKQDKFRKLLKGEALDIWRTPYWEKEGRTLLIELMKVYHERTIRNIGMLEQDPSSLTVGKSPDTGTGWMYPWDTRGALQKDFPNAAPMMREVVDRYYRDFIEALGHWPEQGDRKSVV